MEIQVERIGAQRQGSQRRGALRLYEYRLAALLGIRIIVEHQLDGGLTELAALAAERNLHHRHDDAGHTVHGVRSGEMIPVSGENLVGSEFRGRFGAVDLSGLGGRIAGVVRRIQPRHVAETFVHLVAGHLRGRNFIPAPARRDARGIIAEEAEAHISDRAADDDTALLAVLANRRPPAIAGLADIRHLGGQPGRMAILVEGVEEGFQALAVVAVDEIPASAVAVRIPPAAGLRDSDARQPGVVIHARTIADHVRRIRADLVDGLRPQRGRQQKQHEQHAAEKRPSPVCTFHVNVSCGHSRIGAELAKLSGAFQVTEAGAKRDQEDAVRRRPPAVATK
ncbi:MAG: hypothetical protein J0H86_19075 [Xanthomonadaceae bacterium]|nr:hypothetical protein [Xanthomonadaceae bacterium]